MNAAEQAAAIVLDLNDALEQAVLKPSPENLCEVSRLINALHTTREQAIRDEQEAA